MVVERRTKEAIELRGFFHEQWQHLSELLGVDEKAGLVDEAIDEVVDGTDARVRAVYHYKKSLRTGVRKLLNHVDGIIEQLAGTIKLSRKTFVYDSQVSSLLGSMDEVNRLCEESDEVKEYIKSSYTTEQDCFFALLFMNYHEKEIFGDELKGDFIHRDVRQISVFFTGHRLLAPAVSEIEVKTVLKHILLEDVVEYLKLLLSRELQHEKEQIDIHSFNNSMETLKNPARYLDELVTILELPIDLISLEDNTIRMNKMGIKVSDVDNSCDEIHLQKFEIGDNQNNLIALVEIAYNDIS